MSTPINEEILRVGISYHMCRLRDMPFDEEMVTNEAYAKFPVQPQELFFDVTTIKKVVEPEELVKEIRARHKPNDMLIFVHTLTGKVIGLELNDDYKVEEVKVLIQQQEGWVPAVQRLLRCGKPMGDEKTLKDYNVTDRSSIHMVLSLRGGGCIAYELVPDGFDPQWNYNFSAIVVDPNPFYRGGSIYIRPLESMRYALKVLGKYENDLWLGCTGSAQSGEWPVAFHGTTDPRAAEIVKSGGLKAEKGVHFQYGYGIYCTPDPKTALAYASTYFYKGQCYKLIVQVRIDPARRDIIPKSMHAINGLDDFWIAKENDAIRPYGICIYHC